LGWPALRIAADTNILVRIVTRDEPVQSQTAFKLVSTAEQVIISLPCLCEFVWVLRAVYRFNAGELETAVRSVTEPGNVVTERATVEAGLRLLAEGGDFADGIIAQIGLAMGAEAFVSFDRKAVATMRKMGIPAELPSAMA
jgi:predicted nucleic-acid-binding protein